MSDSFHLARLCPDLRAEREKFAEAAETCLGTESLSQGKAHELAERCQEARVLNNLLVAQNTRLEGCPSRCAAPSSPPPSPAMWAHLCRHPFSLLAGTHRSPDELAQTKLLVGRHDRAEGSDFGWGLLSLAPPPLQDRPLAHHPHYFHLRHECTATRADCAPDIQRRGRRRCPLRARRRFTAKMTYLPGPLVLGIKPG